MKEKRNTILDALLKLLFAICFGVACYRIYQAVSTGCVVTGRALSLYCYENAPVTFLIAVVAYVLGALLASMLLVLMCVWKDKKKPADEFLPGNRERPMTSNDSDGSHGQ